MALSKVNNSLSLKKSLEHLSDITTAAYNDEIRNIALRLWQKHLNPTNPQWQYIKYESFYISEGVSKAHVMAMLDKRLPDIGIVGYFACTNAEVGAEVLRMACDWLRDSHRLKDVYGPINGTLPSDYRLNLSDNYAFPGEPVNPVWFIRAFELAGFKVFNHYSSGRLRRFDLLLKFKFKSRPKEGYEHLKVRQFDATQHEAEFKRYHNLRNQIFPFMSVYCPAISLDERIYNAAGKFDPNYTYFLQDKEREVGFVMAYEYDNQLILKTIGLLAEYRGKNLSGLLLKPVHDHALKTGLRTAIYGMVREGNRVHKNKHPLAKVFRHYVTMHKSL